MNIGIVEGNDDLRALYISHLRERHHATVVVVNAAPPFAVADNFAIADLHMVIVEPHPADVDLWLEVFRASHPHTYVILASSRPDILTDAVKFDLRVAALTKPFHMEELSQVIDVMVDPTEISPDRTTH